MKTLVKTERVSRTTVVIEMSQEEATAVKNNIANLPGYTIEAALADLHNSLQVRGL